MPNSFEFDVETMNVEADHFKYYILLVFPNIIVGFDYKDGSTYPKYEPNFKSAILDEGTQNPGDQKTENSKTELNYEYYETMSSFKCIHPSIIFYMNNNDLSEIELVHKYNPNSFDKYYGFLDISLMDWVKCPNPKSLIGYLNHSFDIESIRSVATPKTNIEGNIMRNQNREIDHESEIIASKTSLYLQKKLEKISIISLTNSKMIFPLKNFFPYPLTKIEPISIPGFSIELKLHQKDTFLYPKILNNSSIYRGIINKKSQGYDLLNIVLIQGGRNVLLSNEIQGLHENLHQNTSEKYSFISKTKPSIKKETFEYQVKKQKKSNSKDVSLFSDNLNQMAEYYLKELGLDFGYLQQSINTAYWDTVKKEQKLLKENLKGKSVIHLGGHDLHGDCKKYKNEYFFRKRKNLMELLKMEGT
jgi:hypothetical protein